jgi:regulatory protein
MAGTITALESQKRNKERVNVYLDGEYAFAVTLVVAAGLQRGQLLSDDEIEALKAQDERTKAYNRAISFLGFRSRSEAEMEIYLHKKGVSSEVIVETIERLKRQDYIDDAAFARAWIRDRGRLKPRGRRALHYELAQKGISREVIDTALADLDEDELAWRAIEGKLRQWQHLSEADLRKKAMGHLSRRGFNYEVSRQAVDQAVIELESRSN